MWCPKLLLCLACWAVGALARVDESKIANRTIERTVQLRTHSIYAPYIDQDLQNRWWDFGADAYINTNKHVRLTRARPSQMGWLWSRLPITAANFVIEVEFKISGDSTHLFGDGLAIWLTKDRAQPGPVFGSIDRFDGLGIFIDTYANSRHSYSFPRIMAIKGDGKTNYDLGNDGDSQSLGACSANVRRTNVATKAKITYVKDEYLDVKLQYKAWDDWSDCFTLKGLSLPMSPFLGFSAMTGDVFDSHDIIAVTTSSAILSAPDSPRDKIRPFSFGSRKSSGSGSWMWTFIKLALFVAFCYGTYYGYQTYVLKNGGRGFGGGHGRGFSFSGFGSNRGFGGMYNSGKRF
ncbi:concanavalin A-like lectin/glucanase [Punctularia strigosozonata HHB-11173 SS5]|uniref:concanavalin A-like lectin/glucanase n=1 Tax=Punctularia strigosozonata (strain HHB-11173) TaxID=741275 RepID=UPI0004416867|nr:concanavalin A-like lectin/glucanase [Punctularia strigosozonata HHB-11173 SS5]EIN06594.1 concanavalin A-like lectin/glucanase [Punctularia strigosozonata HHB-11173 SS5]